jgi:hypothetical protein
LFAGSHNWIEIYRAGVYNQLAEKGACMPLTNYFYTMNLGFDTTNATLVQNGEFVDPPSGSAPLPPALSQSKVWLQSAVVASDPSASFSVLPDSKVSVNVGDTIYVRLFCASVTPPIQLTTRITAVFGRKGNNQNYRTPFHFANQVNIAQAVFDSDPNMSPNFGVSWLVGLDLVGNAPEQGQIDNYGFIVGATVWADNSLYTFGHDPEMNVGMGAGMDDARAQSAG